jgi:hypothetical protein
LGGSLLAAANPAEDRAQAALSRRVQLFFFFNPGMAMLVTDSSQPVRSEVDERLNVSASSRRILRSKSLLNQPAAILATNSRMGNNFLHFPQSIDWAREDWHRPRTELWNFEPIRAFVMMVRNSTQRNSSMSRSIATLFCKTAECPTSQALLAYRRSLTSRNLAYIEAHLACCDFCSAELQLLTRYRSEAEKYSFAEMPAQLRRLAEDLLKRSSAPFRGLGELAENHHVSH